MTSSSNRFSFVDYLGLEASTTYEGNPYFFLFDEIDTHNAEELRQHLSVFIERQLTFFWYQTSKGWHILSPSLLSLKQWDSARRELSRMRKNHYPNLVIRIERKPHDSYHLFVENLDFSQKFLVSSSFCDLYQKKFQTSLHLPKEQQVDTKLVFTHYTQVILKECTLDKYSKMDKLDTLYKIGAFGTYTEEDYRAMQNDV